MTMDNDRDNNGKETPAPPKLVAVLRRSQSNRVFVPPTVDEAILRAARNQLAPARPPRRSSLAARLRWPAFATACVLVVVMAHRLSRPDSPSNSGRAFVREDVNHDKRVDILDAFQLARQLDSGAKPLPNYDVTGDGVVDRRDIEFIAAQAVKLEKGRRS